MNILTNQIYIYKFTNYIRKRFRVKYTQTKLG
jgi:hypothetical protein